MIRTRNRRIAIFLAFVLLLPMAGCGKADRMRTVYNEAQALFDDGKYEAAQVKFVALEDYEDCRAMAASCSAKLDPTGTVLAYIAEHGTPTEAGGSKMYMPTSIPHTEIELTTREDPRDPSVTVKLKYTDAVGGVVAENLTMLDIIGDPGGTVIHTYSLSAGGSKVTSIGTGSIDRAHHTAGKMPYFSNFYSSLSNAAISNEFILAASDGIDCIMEEFSAFLKKIDPALTLRDVGVSQYEIDPDRHSAIRSGGIAGEN